MSKRRQSTATTSTLARVNQTAILEVLRSAGTLSRQQIGARTGLSPATVNRLTATLIGEGVVEAAGQEPSTGGRPSILLRYSGGSRLVAAMQLHADRASGVLVNFDGQIVFRRDAVFVAAPAPVKDTIALTEQESQLALILDLFDVLLATAIGMNAPCLAVGVAVPGVVQFPEGSVGRMPEFGWNDVPLGRLFRERTDIPVIVENDANALAFGELQRGAGRGLSSLVSLFLDRGFGAGIITNGELHRGARAEAGEVGYLLMDRSAFNRSYNEYGDLEDRIGSVALTRQAIERGIPLPDAGVMTAKDIFELASGGNAAARDIADEILDMVSIAIAALVIVLDPELVVVGSSFLGNAEMAIPGIQQRLSGRIIRVPRVEAATFRDDAVLIGVAELATTEVNDFAYLAY
ncbi:MAG TPA: ROK family transcriptional regulator [Galbitalea sp.]|jgi:predicted NBD/HSP70 family sugar kinase